jgi:ribosomal protein S18 acetylase RimI-like enzyme
VRHAALDAETPDRAAGRRIATLSDIELYRRGTDTVLAAWGQYARGARGASVRRLAGVAAAVFPSGAERGVYNNAIFERGLFAAQRTDAIFAMEAAYEAAGVARFAAWVHESDNAMRSDLERRGYTLDEVTRAMGMTLDRIALPRPTLAFRRTGWPEHRRVGELPPDLLGGADPASFHIFVARSCGEDAATAIAFDQAGDCGIYNVGTLERARHRGLATALTATHLHAARARGCQTASLQSTAIAESVYTAAGFRDLGRILEYVPARA